MEKICCGVAALSLVSVVGLAILKSRFLISTLRFLQKTDFPMEDSAPNLSKYFISSMLGTAMTCIYFSTDITSLRISLNLCRSDQSFPSF